MTTHDLGSSPRMRGTRQGHNLDCGLPRIIPADAGNTPACTWITIWMKDHPRGCGEHVMSCNGRTA